MSNYKTATQLKLRYNTSIGELSTEQLWDLSLTQLDELAISLQESYKELGKKSFLDKKSEKDTIAKLQFDIVLDVLKTKQTEQEELANAKETKLHNEKILGLISAKEDEALSNKSVSDLKKMIK